LCSCDF